MSQTLDRAAERREDAAWIHAQAVSDHARYMLLDAEGQAYVQPDHAGLRWLDYTERERWLPGLYASFLGRDGERPYFLLALDHSHPAVELEKNLSAQRVGLRGVGLHWPADEAGLFAYAKALAHWQRETRFCAYCGAVLVLVAAGHRAQCTNKTCGRLHFPRTDAAIIVMVEHEGACLLGRQASWPQGRYSTLAGFVEPGEALEDAVRREVAEESGVIVDHMRYDSSQPWPMPQSLMVSFIATAVSRTIRRRDRELEDARWFTPQDIADGLADGSFVAAPPLSVAYRLLAHWLHQRAGLDLAALIARAGR